MTVSWRDDLPTAQARLAALEAAETKRFTNETVKSVRYQVGGVEYADPVSMDQLARAIFETRAVIRRLGGGCVTGGAIVPTFGG